ncbi:hypothetical protein CHARACLAT_009510 [Characodon lateralis]|uniref:Uncharacterized protein n=1 Tax=Characodon lateralis TaxID=208331 RepID=A0ABU7CZN8_9TELE|nr:hypothetical protein [Characodon lateralis]
MKRVESFHRLKWYITCRLPNLLARLIFRGRSASSISEALVLFCGSLEDLDGGVPDGFAATYVLVDRGNCDAGLISRKQRRLVTKGCFEGRTSCSRGNMRI